MFLILVGVALGIVLPRIQSRATTRYALIAAGWILATAAALLVHGARAAEKEQLPGLVAACSLPFLSIFFLARAEGLMRRPRLFTVLAAVVFVASLGLGLLALASAGMLSP